MSTYKYTIKDIENCREEITSLINNNKDRIPNYEDFISYPKTRCHLCYYDESAKTPNKFIYPSIPNYFVRSNHAKRLGYDLNNAIKIVGVQDIEGDVIDYLYDVRTLKFRPINPNCNLDKLMEQTQRALFKVKGSFLHCNDDILIKILKGKREKIN